VAIRIRDKKTTGAGVSMRDGNGEKPTTEIESKNQIPDVRSFRELAIVVINELESKGIDLYDPTRTPGMYLKRRGTFSVPDVLLRKLSDRDGPPSTTQEPNPSHPAPVVKHTGESQQNIPAGLFNFLTNKK
jgi:hypothetical protein